MKINPLKLTIFFTFLLSFSAFLTIRVYSFKEPNNFNFDDTYKEQFKSSGGSALKKNLPKEAIAKLEKFGITGESWDEFSKLESDKILEDIISVSKEKGVSILAVAGEILAVILICAIFENFKPKNSIGEILAVVGRLCLCVCLVDPILKCIWNIALVIKSASGFVLCFVPVMTGIMIASGKTISASSYNVLMLGAGQVSSQIAGNFIVPLMNTILGISIISGISTKINLDGLCKIFHKIAKVILGFITTIFVGILTIQTSITASADSATNSGIKFAVGTCVPIIGNALGDAVKTVHGCIDLLKSGIGAFGLMAGISIFLPVFLECTVWILFLWGLSMVSETFNLSKISSILKNISEVMSTLFAVIISSIVILVVSMVAVAIMF